MTLLGLAALAYYAVLLAAGVLSPAVMPQFIVTAIIFLSSGRLVRKGARRRFARDDDDDSEQTPRVEPNWKLRTQLLNWGMSIFIITILSLWVMKPVGVPFLEFLQMKFIYGYVDHEASWNFIFQVPPP